MNWLQRTALKLFRVRAPLDPVQVPSNRITAAQWRKDERMVDQAMRLRQNRIYTLQLEVLRVHHPGHCVYPDAVLAERQLGRIEGYQLCLDLLDSLAIPEVTRDREEATFEPPVEDKPRL